MWTWQFNQQVRFASLISNLDLPFQWQVAVEFQWPSYICKLDGQSAFANLMIDVFAFSGGFGFAVSISNVDLQFWWVTWICNFKGLVAFAISSGYFNFSFPCAICCNFDGQLDFTISMVNFHLQIWWAVWICNLQGQLELAISMSNSHLQTWRSIWNCKFEW